ncbi:MAG: ATP synthase F1 subunit delta [Planctomycetes bacterium]|nr:ATP synthase F1 subunit delta [Planctomycetota bacterium]
MANVETTHETVLDAAAARSRLARVYAAALLVAADKSGPKAAEEVGAELTAFARAAAGNPGVAAFLASPAVGKKKKAAALAPVLQRHGSELLRGLVGTLASNSRLDLLRGVAAAFAQLLDDRSGRVRVKVTAAVPLTGAQTDALLANLRASLGNQEPVLDVRVDPDLLGGLVVQVGDAVVDTSVRSRLQSLRTLLLEKGTSNG